MAGPNLHLDSNVGCLFIGTSFSLVLFGCTAAQTIFYCANYPDDRLALKALVASLSILDFVTLLLDIQYLWTLAVQNHANPAAIDIVPRFWITEFFLASLTFLIVQLFFIHKIWTLLEGNSYRLLLSLSVVCSRIYLLYCLRRSITRHTGIFGFSEFCRGRRHLYRNSFLFILPHVEVPGTLQQLASVFTDVYITISLCIILRRSQATYERTQTLLGKLSVYAINRGMLSAAIQLLHYATYAATYRTTSFIWMVFHIPGSKVYVNALLAMLNLRHKLRDAHSTPPLDLTSIRFDIPEHIDSQPGEPSPQQNPH
ncbi:hypothetical protein OBBRIDRAFT_383171 [Obba rivulosa]|uniref:DUF6534 domain-containing protein n=1 Tax=Obba rivulosa TaxID=1052685 RepID=A0A8E2AM13_9APHY|nr:hypothetical protein OBBRIDRAFT_383171 [Obba rivulosa]